MAIIFRRSKYGDGEESEGNKIREEFLEPQIFTDETQILTQGSRFQVSGKTAKIQPETLNLEPETSYLCFICVHLWLNSFGCGSAALCSFAANFLGNPQMTQITQILFPSLSSRPSRDTPRLCIYSSAAQLETSNLKLETYLRFICENLWLQKFSF